MHCKWQQVFDAYGDERGRMTESLVNLVPNTRGALNPDGTVRAEVAADYPVYAALYPALQQGDLYDKLRKSDGITEYSREWWSAFEAGKADIQVAYHETLPRSARGTGIPARSRAPGVAPALPNDQQAVRPGALQAAAARPGRSRHGSSQGWR
jgi:hypothetical protein